MTDTAFNSAKQQYKQHGAAALFETLCRDLRERREYHKLFDALCLKQKHALELPLGRPTSFEDVFHTHLEEADGGHVRWTGPVLDRTPAVRFDGRLQSAYRVAFRLHHGREPEGLAMPACDVPLCVAGGCLDDRPMRDAKQLEERQARQREKQLDRLYAGIFGRAA